MKILCVGDPHCVASELEDCQLLIDKIIDVLKVQDIDKVVFTGDLFHDHAIVNVDVLDFWYNSFIKITKWCHIVALVGNHDRSSISGKHALKSFDAIDDVDIVDEPMEMGGILFCPYYPAEELVEFIQECQKRPDCPTAYVHATFDGTQYDNGFYAKEAVDPRQLPQKNIISGHIHKPQILGKVQYVGSPRARIISDANQERSIWIIEHDDNGEIVNRTPIPSPCRQIYHYVCREGEELWSKSNSRDLYCYDLHGSQAWIDEAMKMLKRPGVRIRPFPINDNKKIIIKESEGIVTSLKKWSDVFEPQFGTPKEVLLDMMKGLI